ncbi:CD63 antigen-like [Penaeus chinensis]|uniref:CD63 antigen-like n=1 Tax=Penaeus chinensis TaxID=139456 RepID=UPI001FB7EFFB|nr:CD63 antigen-like [Penaeus chinensis]
MALDTGMKCIKYLLFIFNLLFVLSGCTLIIVGAVIEAHYSLYLDFISHSYISAPSILIAVGVLIFVVGFFGCCGAIKENHCMVVTFAVLLCMIFVVQLGVGITSYVLSSDVEEFLEVNMRKSMHNYNSSRTGVYRTWNVVQHEHACCGTMGYIDWRSTTYGESVNGVPDACCKEFTTDCGRNVFSDSSKLPFINEGGCFDKLKGDVKDNITILGGVAIGIGCVQLIGIAFACCLAKSLKRQYETV